MSPHRPQKAHAEIHEVLFDIGEKYGYRLSVGDQVYVAEYLGAVTKPLAADVLRALRAAGTLEPPRGYCGAVAGELRRVRNRMTPSNERQRSTPIHDGKEV